MFKNEPCRCGIVMMCLVFITESLPAAEHRTIIAAKVQNPPRIDGRLDDPCWREAVPTSDFVQMEPEEGEPATEQTIVRVVYDENNLYFGIECLDSQPDKITARLVPRDSNFWPGDLITIVLDTFHDHQNCYGFQVNPRGIQRDFRSEGDGRRGWGGIDLAWDGLWWSECMITDRGWTVEVAIPFKTLRFPRKREQVWGINIQRYQSSRREDSDWSPITRADLGIIKVSKAGHLVGIRDIKPGLHLELLPYGTTRYNQNSERRAWQKDLGLDLKYGLTSDITLDLTLNPDFAHIEADEERINLTRYELFYEEKRPFFIEKSELFTPMKLFYSRRIADPKFGAKLTGKLGGYSFGLLSALDEEEGENPIYGVLGLRRDILENSSLGIIGVAKWKSENDYGLALGTELGLRWPRGSLDLEWAKSFNPGSSGDDWRASLRARYAEGNFWAYGSLEELRPEFNVDRTGYAPHDPHVGERKLEGSVSYRYQIEKFGIRWLGFYQGIRLNKRTDDPRWGWNWVNANFYFELENYDRLGFLHEDWCIRWQGDGYRGRTLGLAYDIRGKGFVRRAFVSAKMGDYYDWGDDYFGKMKELSLWAETRLRDNLGLDLDGRIVWEYLPSGRLDEVKEVVNLRVTYLPTKKLFVRVFLPFNPGARQYAINALLSWTYRPLSRFYLAYNERREDRSGDMELVDRIIMAKLSYLWNL